MVIETSHIRLTCTDLVATLPVLGFSEISVWWAMVLLSIHFILTLISRGRGTITILCWRVENYLKMFSRLSLGQSLNSSLSAAVNQKKNRALYLSCFNCGGLTKFENTFFKLKKIDNLTDFFVSSFRFQLLMHSFLLCLIENINKETKRVTQLTPSICRFIDFHTKIYERIHLWY